MSLEVPINVPNAMGGYMRSLWCENTQTKRKMRQNLIKSFISKTKLV